MLYIFAIIKNDILEVLSLGRKIPLTKLKYPPLTSQKKNTVINMRILVGDCIK